MTEGPREMDPKADTKGETAKGFLEGGGIVEDGTHDNLIARSGHCRRLHELKPGRHEVGKLA